MQLTSLFIALAGFVTGIIFYQILKRRFNMRSKKSRQLDRARISMEGHEIDYIKRAARNHLKNTKRMKQTDKIEIRVGSLRRLCKVVLKLTK